MKLRSAVLSTVLLSLFATASLTACQPGFGVLKLTPQTPPKTSPQSSNEVPASGSPAPSDSATPSEEQGSRSENPSPSDSNAPAQSPSSTDSQAAPTCPIQLLQTSFPLPKEDFERHQGKPMCVEEYFQIRQLHRMVADLDRGAAYEDPNILRFYDMMVFKIRSNDRAKRDFGIEGRTRLVSEIWTQMRASMKTAEGACSLEFRDGQMSLDLMRHGPIQRVDNEHGNPGNRFVMKSEDYEDPHWSLKCPMKSSTGDVEMKTVKQGKYFYVFLDVYENAKDPKNPEPTHLIQYLLSAS